MNIKALPFRLLASFSVLFYIGAYHDSYVRYLHPVFDYAHYRLVDRDALTWVFCYLFTLFPFVCLKDNVNPLSKIISILYIVLYVPTQVTIYAMYQGGEFRLFLFSILLCIGQVLVQVLSSVNSRIGRESSQDLLQFGWNKRISACLIVFTLAALIVVLIENLNHISFVDFSAVYDLRSQSRESSSGLGGYCQMLLFGVSIPYFFAAFYTKRDVRFLVFSIVICLLLYASGGSKSSLLISLFFGIAFLTPDATRACIIRLAQFFTVALFASNLLPDGIFSTWFKAIFIQRLLSSPGWALSVYEEYFSSHGYTYLTHSSLGVILGRIYEFEPGQLIGLEYSGSVEANFNANFWATDAIASFGLIGILPISFLVGLVLRLFAKSLRRVSGNQVTLFMSGFIVNIINASVLTSLVSGGGIVLLAIARMSLRSDTQALNPASSK